MNKLLSVSAQMRTFLNLLPSSEGDHEKFVSDQPLEVRHTLPFTRLARQLGFQYSVTEVWSVPYVGTVVNGIINSGHIKSGDPVLLGPDSNGNYLPTVVKTMQRKRSVTAWTM
jgi:GTPase